MIPFKRKMLRRLVEQISPVLPGPAADVVKAALGIASPPEPGAKAPAGWQSCMGRPSVMPDLSALMGRRNATARPAAGAAQPIEGSFVSRSLATPVGPLSYKVFTPAGEAKPTAMVVMLHGCSQDAADFAAGTGMNAVAQREGLLVVYPEQSRSANMSRCWNWFLAQNQGRDRGEAAAIAAVIQAEMTQHGIAPGRVLVAGLSAGGAMAAIMAEVYPELFGAVGIHSGLPVGAAHDMASAFSAMRHGGAVAPSDTGPQASRVPTVVFHGDADSTVDPGNAVAIVARIAARENGLKAETESGKATGGRGYLKTTGRDPEGRVRFESWSIKGAGHAWSGGATAGSYTDPAGPDASAAMVGFFLHQLGATRQAVVV